MTPKSYFFCGIGGSGMMPLAEIVRAQGHIVAGSDRSLDQGRLSAKFESLEKKGIALFPQDGSGVASRDQIVIASAAVEASVPDIIQAETLGCTRMTRAELLAELFNAAPISIAIGGTSGKSTVTGMIGWILSKAGYDPTIMNGAVMKNFDSGSRVGTGKIFVSEVDESDGSIALYRPTIAVLNNVSVDHKSLEELRALFGAFVARADIAVINAENEEALALASVCSGKAESVDREKFPIGLFDWDDAVLFSLGAMADFDGTGIMEMPDHTEFTISNYNQNASRRAMLAVPGRHNVSNAVAAVAACSLAGVGFDDCVSALASFTGLKRRMETVGTANGVTVIDDFGHNPDKISATLDALHAFPGRLLVMFQPHGFGPIRLMGRELAETFASKLGADDRLVMPDPVYFGGTVDRTQGSETITAAIGPRALHIPDRAAGGDWLAREARPGDRIIIMGARDDTLSVFAKDLLARLGND